MRFDGSPYDLLPAMEEAFGAVFCYRLANGGGAPLLLLAALTEVQLVTDDGPLPPSGLADRIDAMANHSDAAADGPPYIGDLVFAFAYDLHWALRPPELPAAPTAAKPRGPVAVLARIETAVVCDEGAGTLEAYGPGAGQARSLAAGAAHHAARKAPVPLSQPLAHVVADLDRERYAQQVQLAKRYFDKGDVYQALISVRVPVRPKLPLHSYFEAVSRRYSAARYGYWLAAGGIRMFGTCSLPHILVSGDRVSTRVFAGTAPAGIGPAEVARMRADPKYFGEHVMLVDLERHDIGALALPGQVWVEQMLEAVVVGPTTYLATNVCGAVPAGSHLSSLLLGTFPRGVVIGAPKLRAQEIVAEIEGEPRGFYSGAVGLCRLATNEVISNTIVTCGQVEADTVVLSCGGGVTNESIVEQELSELDLKLAYLR